LNETVILAKQYLELADWMNRNNEKERAIKLLRKVVAAYETSRQFYYFPERYKLAKEELSQLSPGTSGVPINTTK